MQCEGRDREHHPATRQRGVEERLPAPALVDRTGGQQQHAGVQRECGQAARLRVQQEGRAETAGGADQRVERLVLAQRSAEREQGDADHQRERESVGDQLVQLERREQGDVERRDRAPSEHQRKGAAARGQRAFEPEQRHGQREAQSHAHLGREPAAVDAVLEQERHAEQQERDPEPVQPFAGVLERGQGRARPGPALRTSPATRGRMLGGGRRRSARLRADRRRPGASGGSWTARLLAPERVAQSSQPRLQLADRGLERRQALLARARSVVHRPREECSAARVLRKGRAARCSPRPAPSRRVWAALAANASRKAGTGLAIRATDGPEHRHDS